MRVTGGHSSQWRPERGVFNLEGSNESSQSFTHHVDCRLGVLHVLACSAHRLPK